ncbi:hypothetical protein BD779DRAFT_1570037 [Infundibulicybe gibba]|nr:hypothetical protein BD779DRAFT_1570037 [Infundibulicybe gibba]
MFYEPSLSTITQLLGPAAGDSAAMQGLFGISFLAEDETLTVSKSLGVLLKMGRIRLQTSQSATHIDDYMHSAHEYLAISCARRLAAREAGPGETVDSDPDWYAKCWSNHLMRARPSEQLFETLRCVDISRRDIDPVLRWLEASPNAPEDVLTRWHAARADPGITIADGPSFDWEEGKGCLLDQVVKQRLDLRAKLDRDNEYWMEIERRGQQMNGDRNGWGQ